MSQEIELKLQVEPTQRDAILALCEQLSKSSKYTQMKLGNAYFDTSDLRLRQFDIGLRIRERDGAREQTVKLAGEVLGGLHRRPEFNTSIDANIPDLSLFDEDIWPDDFPTFDIQRDLQEIFRTDFTRHRWRLPSGSGIIELVFDEGEVIAGKQRQTICEIELEVQDGDTTEAYALARQFITEAQARVGSLSKAARGYLLAQKTVLEPFTHVHFVPQEEQFSVGEGLFRALVYAVQYWQHNDACLGEEPSIRAVAGIADGIRLCRAVLQQLSSFEMDVASLLQRLESLLDNLEWLHRYDGLNELTAKDGAYHRALQENTKLFEQIQKEQEHAVQLEEATALRKHSDYQLALFEIGELCALPWQQESLTKTTLKQWAVQHLRQDWEQVSAPFSQSKELRPEQYMKQLPLLQSSLLTGYCIGFLFDEEAREKFRAPWLDLARGIREIWALKHLRSAIKHTAEINTDRLLSWQEVQLESLLYALERSRRAAMKQEPYWNQ